VILFALLGVLLLALTPAESTAVVKKDDKCFSLVLKTVMKCFLEPLNKRSCKKQNKLGKLTKTITRLQEKDLTALVDMCNHCDGCKQNGKACVAGRMTLGAKDCTHVLKSFGNFGKK
ncbi:hypothetical protein FBUS_05021, partial [Fasciolopsis buskii]